MGLYDTFKLTNSRPMSTYVAAPIEDFKETAQALTEKYSKSFGQTVNNIGVVSTAQAADFENDRNMLSELQSKYNNFFKSQLEQGDFENMGQSAVLAGVKFQQDYTPIKDNLNRYNSWKTDLDKQLSEGKIDQSSYYGAINYSKRNYKGLDKDNIESSKFNGYKPAEYVDIQKMMFERANGWKASGSESPFKYTGNGWFTKDGKREVKESEVAAALKLSLMSDPKAKAYLKDQILFNVPEVVEKEDVTGIRASYIDMYKNDPASVEAIKQMTPKQIYAKNYQDTLIENAVRPAAIKESFIETKLDQQRDPLFDYERKLKAKEEVENQTILDNLRTKHGNFVNNPAYEEMKNKFSGIDNFYDSKGNLKNPSTNNLSYADKSRVYNAMEQTSLYKAAYVTNLAKQRSKFAGNRVKFDEYTAKIKSVQNMSDKDLIGKIMQSIEQRQAALVTDIALPSEAAIKLQKEFVGARDFSGRGVIVDGMPGVTSINQLLAQLDLGEDDAKNAVRVKSFYDSIRISGINLTGGDGAGTAAAIGGLRFSAIDPNTGKVIEGLIENNNEVKPLYNTLSKANMFALTNTSIGFPIDYNHKDKYTPQEQDAKYAGHVLPDLFSVTGHRMIIYNTIDEDGTVTPTIMRQKLTDDKGWINTPLPNQIEAVNQNRISNDLVGKLSYQDLEKYVKQGVTNYEINPRLRKPTEKYDTGVEQDAAE